MAKNYIDKIVTLPKKTVRILEGLGKPQNLKVKNYIEQTLIAHAEENAHLLEEKKSINAK